ncbi:MAG: haloacid dehalogenase-like hydrolase [Thermoplasmata archaeon]|nr:haloacid dehalogenase-like hydrolase [Thermoplasmata archaeon]
MQRLVLFDIDGTLLSASGVSGRALGEALRETFGVTGPMEGYDYSGKTDPLIVRELMTSVGFSPAEIDRGMAATLALYQERLAVALRPEHVRPKPGVGALLAALEDDPRATLGLLTGNLEPCARLKLEPLGVNGHFSFGAYGSDHEDRRRLPAVAVERAQRATGLRFEGKQIVVVGDSVHDVRCGRGLGVRAVAVASGKTRRETLAAESPDALLPDFGDTDRSLRAIFG